MKTKLFALGLVLALSTWAVSGCTPSSIPPTSAPTPGPTDVPAPTSVPTTAPTEVPTPTSAPTEVAVEGPGPVRDVAYEGITFSYDAALAAGVVAETVPAVGPQEAPEWAVEPQHFRFSFDGYVLPNTFHEPRILVYPVAEFEAANENAARVIANLRQLLADKPAAPGAIPILPLFNAAQMMRAQVAYPDFQNGTGVRFLAQYDQAYLPINNCRMFYTFQGLTSDGQYHVAAILPISHPSLPADEGEIPGGDYDAFVNNFETYASEVAQRLDAADGASFTPGLPALDALIQSLRVAPEVQ